VPTARLVPYIGEESECLYWFRYGLLTGTVEDGSGWWCKSGGGEVS